MTQINVRPSILEREYAAAPDVIFDAWTKPELLQQWMFPMPGCTCDYTQADIRPGGTSLHKITMPNGNAMWLLTKYEEVQRPDKLVFFQYMANEAGDIQPNTHMPNWPKDMRLTLTLEPKGDGTKLILAWEPHNPTEAEAKVFDEMRDQNGWASGLDQLERFLAA